MIDINKAYDTVDKGKITDTLSKWGINGNMLRFVENFLHNRCFRVIVGDAISTRRTLDRGIPQGSILSVTLFLILMESLYEHIPHGVQIFVYADDVILLASNKCPIELRRTMQQIASALESWSQSVKLQISPEKSNFMHICKKKKKTSYSPGDNVEPNRWS